MVGQSPSIQSFFPLKASLSKHLPSQKTLPIPGDGFTSEELDKIMQSEQLNNWTPSECYDEYKIESLSLGPSRFKIVGRVVNLFESSTTAKSTMSPTGSLHLVVKDNTAAVTIRLSYSKRKYKLRIGQLVAVWAIYVSNGDQGTFPCPVAPSYIRIFPERDKSCHLRILHGSESMVLCRKSLNLENDLMSLRNFIQGGFEVVDAKILVVVKSISARKRVQKKGGTEVDLVNVSVMDDTADAQLTLWGIASNTPVDWQPSHTILLLSSPGLDVSHRNLLSLASGTFVDVDPDIRDAVRLRSYATRMIRREHVNPPFPDEDYDVWSLTKPDEDILYTLADLDDRAREHPGAKFEGYLSMVIVDLNISTLRQQNMLMSNECCGIPLYANATTAKCKHCDDQVPLRVNPRVIGKLVDESGSIGNGKLVLSDHAWTRLLGRSAEEMIRDGPSLLRSVEYRMLYVRITLRFWWSEEVGRLAVFDVME